MVQGYAELLFQAEALHLHLHQSHLMTSIPKYKHVCMSDHACILERQKLHADARLHVLGPEEWSQSVLCVLALAEFCTSSFLLLQASLNVPASARLLQALKEDI